MIEALIVDDQEDFRVLAGMYVRRDSEVSVAGHAKNGLEALDAIETVDVDVVVLDEVMPHMNGLETAAVIRERRPGIGIVLCSAHVDHETEQAAARAGVHVCMAKDDVARLPDAIRRAAKAAA